MVVFKVSVVVLRRVGVICAEEKSDCSGIQKVTCFFRFRSIQTQELTDAKKV